MNKKLISIIIPLHNEEKNIPLIYRDILRIWESVKDVYEKEIIFVNDGSFDQSATEIEKITRIDQGVKYIEFSRNFGKEIATTAGLTYAKGDAAVMIDADLQHPPKVILEFLDRWKEGWDVVVGVRKNQNGKGIFGKILSGMFYKIMNSIGETQLMPSSTDFRIIDRKVINEFNRFTEHGRITRGLIDWLGFRTDYIDFEADERANGVPSYSKMKLLKLALLAFISHSLLPLKLAGYVGALITASSALMGIFILVEKYILDDPLGLHISGTATLAVINLFLTGVILSCLGLVTLYIGNIHSEVINRPLYVISRKNNINEKNI